jgi:hypothetical protein
MIEAAGCGAMITIEKAEIIRTGPRKIESVLKFINLIEFRRVESLGPRYLV